MKKLLYITLLYISFTSNADSDLDRDRDGIIDTIEDSLLKRFAPLIFLHRQETSLPVKVDYLFSNSTLRFNHPGGCSDYELIDWGDVSSELLITQSHRKVNAPPWCLPWNCCDHEGPTLYSNSYTGSPTETFFLQYKDSIHHGMTDSTLWQIYGHAYPAIDGKIALQYWQLYAYNDSIRTINHEGDWEFTAVLIDFTHKVHNVAYYRHGHIIKNRPEEVHWEGDHHITFSAKGSHSQYSRAHASPQIFSLANCYDESLTDVLQGDIAAQDDCEPGIRWDTWNRRIVNVGERHFPLPGANWIQFSGLWGEIGSASLIGIEFTSGPRGPAYQNNSWRLWGSYEICGNDADDDLDGRIDESTCRPRIEPESTERPCSQCRSDEVCTSQITPECLETYSCHCIPNEAIGGGGSVPPAKPESDYVGQSCESKNDCGPYSLFCLNTNLCGYWPETCFSSKFCPKDTVCGKLVATDNFAEGCTISDAKENLCTCGHPGIPR